MVCAIFFYCVQQSFYLKMCCVSWTNQSWVYLRRVRYRFAKPIESLSSCSFTVLVLLAHNHFKTKTALASTCIFGLSTELIMWIDHHKPFFRTNRGMVGCVRFIYRGWSYAIDGNLVTWRDASSFRQRAVKGPSSVRNATAPSWTSFNT